MFFNFRLVRDCRDFVCGRGGSQEYQTRFTCAILSNSFDLFPNCKKAIQYDVRIKQLSAIHRYVVKIIRRPSKVTRYTSKQERERRQMTMVQTFFWSVSLTWGGRWQFRFNFAEQPSSFEVSPPSHSRYHPRPLAVYLRKSQSRDTGHWNHIIHQ